MSDDAGPDTFDRMMGALDGLPDVVSVKPTTVQTVTPLVGRTEAWIIQTFRQAKEGDLVFLQHVGQKGTTRLVMPARVAEVIVRQQKALTTKARKKVARRLADERKAAGIVPFQKKVS